MDTTDTYIIRAVGHGWWTGKEWSNDINAAQKYGDTIAAEQNCRRLGKAYPYFSITYTTRKEPARV